MRSFTFWLLQSMSGNLEQSQRYSEQLVLYMKATNLLKSTLKDVELEVASSSQEPPENLRKGEPILAITICLDKACQSELCFRTREG